MLGKKKLLKLGLISVAFITVGALVGLILNYRTLKELRSEQFEPAPSVVAVEEDSEKITTYLGKIKPSIRPEIAAHYLEDDEGEMIVFLKSGKIESGFLEMLEGQAVEVVGTVKKTVAGDQTVMEVDEVHL